MIALTSQDIINLSNLIVEYTGGGSGVRELGLIESATQAILQTFGGIELYPTLEEKGAKLGFLLISNHAFLDGNKRVGLLAMLTFLKINKIELKYTDLELIDLGWGVASGKFSYEDMLCFVNSHKI